ncbi:hypothetical protein [Candidatus Sororendozoicomonas aggregata]|uniref:hypothetical protein n=1 Tax=Candidatus Sororendozoicomonas aggregata TaxID=3073239 RepID=UPI002ED2CD05
MFYKSIQFPSVTILSLALLCIVHAATADAEVYDVTSHGNNTSVITKVSRETTKEQVNVVSKLKITVPKYDREHNIEITADVYYKLRKGDLKTANNKGGWFDFSMSDPTHGGAFGKDKFTLHVWCNGSGSNGFIVRKKSKRHPQQSYIVGHISCEKL